MSSPYKGVQREQGDRVKKVRQKIEKLVKNVKRDFDKNITIE